MERMERVCIRASKSASTLTLLFLLELFALAPETVALSRSSRKTLATGAAWLGVNYPWITALGIVLILGVCICCVVCVRLNDKNEKIANVVPGAGEFTSETGYMNGGVEIIAPNKNREAEVTDSIDGHCKSIATTADTRQPFLVSLEEEEGKGSTKLSDLKENLQQQQQPQQQHQKRQYRVPPLSSLDYSMANVKYQQKPY